MRRLVLVALAGFVVHCSASSSTVGSSGASGAGPAPGGGPARCVGKAVGAYRMRDRDSCTLQGSTWDNVNLECRGTTFPVSCDRPSAKAACLDVPGCGWTEDDGSVTKPSGQCEGTKTPCSSLSKDRDTCVSQTGCSYFSSTGCESKNGFSYLDNVDCGNLQISETVSFSVVRSACQRAKGCTWVE